MAVPVVVIGGVAVIVVLVILIIIYKLLQCRQKSVATSAEKGLKKGDYTKIEDGDRELDGVEAELVGQDDPIDSLQSKDKKTKLKRKSRTKRESVDVAASEGPTSSDQEYITSKGITDEFSDVLSGRLQLSAFYIPSSRELLVTIHQGENLGTDDGLTFEIRITLLPSKTQRFKTRTQSSSNPVFDDFFTFGEVFPQDIFDGVLRARVYRLHGRRRKLVGEMRAELVADLGLDQRNVEFMWREIAPASQIEDYISDTVLVTDPETALMAPKEIVPMLLISLQYKTISGKLTVEIIKARHIKTPTVQKSPEIFVQVTLLNSHGGEIASAKTSLQKGSFHPVFEETFYFPAIDFELPSLTLVFSVYHKKLTKKDLIGRFSLGRESTGEREQLHWSEMIEARGEPIKGWYALS